MRRENIGTIEGTATGTLSLKALAVNYLSNQKQVQPEVRQQVQTEESSQKIDLYIEQTFVPADQPTPAALAHARRMLVACPVQRRKVHCWYCSRCSETKTCATWRTRRADVEFFRHSERPYSLYVLEERDAAEVRQ